MISWLFRWFSYIIFMLNKKKKKEVYMEIFFGVLCLVVIFVAAALNSARLRIAQHRDTLFPNFDDKLPKWWPSQKHLSITSVIFNWIMLITVIANCIWLIVISHTNYIITFAVGGLICWVVGRFAGMALTSAVIKVRGKKNGINVIRECL